MRPNSYILFKKNPPQQSKHVDSPKGTMHEHTVELHVGVYYPATCDPAMHMPNAHTQQDHCISGQPSPHKNGVGPSHARS